MQIDNLNFNLENGKELKAQTIAENIIRENTFFALITSNEQISNQENNIENLEIVKDNLKEEEEEKEIIETETNIAYTNSLSQTYHIIDNKTTSELKDIYFVEKNNNVMNITDFNLIENKKEFSEKFYNFIGNSAKIQYKQNITNINNNNLQLGDIINSQKHNIIEPNTNLVSSNDIRKFINKHPDNLEIQLAEHNVIDIIQENNYSNHLNIKENIKYADYQEYITENNTLIERSNLNEEHNSLELVTIEEFSELDFSKRNEIDNSSIEEVIKVSYEENYDNNQENNQQNSHNSDSFTSKPTDIFKLKVSDLNNFKQDLIDQIKYKFTDINGDKKLTIQLVPEALGKIRIDYQTKTVEKEEKVFINIEVEKKETFDLLNKDINELSSRLQKLNIDIENNNLQLNLSLSHNSNNQQQSRNLWMGSNYEELKQERLMKAELSKNIDRTLKATINYTPDSMLDIEI